MSLIFLELLHKSLGLSSNSDKYHRIKIILKLCNKKISCIAVHNTYPISKAQL